VFSLNSALTSLSYELDLLDRQLLAANNVVQRNLEQLGGAANLTNDTALVEQASTVADDYQNKTVELRKLSERAHQLQAQYIELHEQYNQLVGDVENDDIGETDAEDQFAGYNRRFQTLKAEHDEIVPKLVEALNKHNALIDQYARNLRAYNLLMIEKTLRL
jgi:predicted  nucleic acid-binding Zn-ribbon protein